MSGNLIDVAVMAGTIFVVLLIFAITLTKLYRRASKEVAFVRTGVGANAW